MDGVKLLEDDDDCDPGESWNFGYDFVEGAKLAKVVKKKCTALQKRNESRGRGRSVTLLQYGSLSTSVVPIKVRLLL